MNVRIPNLEHILNSRQDSNSRPHEFVCTILGAYDTHSCFNVYKILLEFQRALIQKSWHPAPPPRAGTKRGCNSTEYGPSMCFH